MCRVLQVSRSGYYGWKHRELSARSKRREAVKVEVKTLFGEYKKRYGAIRLARELNAKGICCSLNYVASLLREEGLKARNGKRFKYTKSGSSKTNIQANVLGRDFSAVRPNEKWVTDITYIFVNGKWLYWPP